MAKKDKKVGSVHAGGGTALSFKKGSTNYTETTSRVSRDSDPLRSRPQQPKKIDPNQQHRASGESITDFIKRREANRSK